MILSVDGVVADFVGHLLAQVGSTRQREEIVELDVFKFLTPEQQETASALLASPDFWLSMPLIPGALEGVQTFQLRGHEIIWATTPWLPCREWEWARRTWIKQHFSARDEDIVVLFEKQLLTGEFFVDDRPESVLAWQRANAHGVAFLYHAPHNAEFMWPQRLDWNVKEEEHGQEDAEGAVRVGEG
jgi:hypothetical protein